MSTDTEEKPEVVAYRVKVIEAKIDTLAEKFDRFHLEVSSRLCSAPGSCVQLSGVVDRLDKAREEDRQRLIRLEEGQAAIRKENDDKAAFVRGAIWVAGGIGTALGFVGPLVVSALKGHFSKG